MNIKYMNIMSEIKNQIIAGTLKAGDKIPSIRYLSEKYGYSKNTVLKAYEELEKLHVIYSVPKSGYFVVHDSHLSTNTCNQNKIDFLSAGPDKRALPYKDVQHCMNQAIDLYKEELFTYSDEQGLLSLRQELVNHLQNNQVFTAAERVFITSGSQQALNLLVQMPFPNGKSNILIEQPSYFGIVESVQVHDITTFGIDLTMDSIDLDRLENMFRNNDIKFFYVIPRFHNPLGHSYTNEQKKKIVELANKYDVYIVEDDIFGDLDYNHKIDPMFAFDPSGRVIYIKSFSKVMLPGLRIGLTVLPELMIHSFRRFKFSEDLFSPSISQGALELYLKNGMFNSHIHHIRDMYRRKMELAIAACRDYLPATASFTEPATGFYLSIYLPKTVHSKRLAQSLQQENILVDQADRMFLPEYRKGNLIRLCLSQVDEEQIRPGIEKIAAHIEAISKKQVHFIEKANRLI
ncbi:PLP-dependent aminotransferase family protein [Pseudobacillus sp. FSL P4-0506]|uniref:aminotransferase-like domain-containing protein n=1 Tax=unclassified Pseudobacillus TaxID=2619284 RepID=UPI0030F93703